MSIPNFDEDSRRGIITVVNERSELSGPGTIGRGIDDRGLVGIPAKHVRFEPVEAHERTTPLGITVAHTNHVRQRCS
jgi:hypothetical protein